MNVGEFLYDLEDQVDQMVRDFREVSAEEGGLDYRAGRVYVTKTHVIAHGGNVRTMNYYGGFEYVSKECTYVVGDFTFWSAEDKRVQEFIEYVYGDDYENEEDDGQPDEDQEWHDYDPGC